MNKILYSPKPGTTGFFLMKDVPINPRDTDINYGDDKNIVYSEYIRSFEACKEEAIKNGDIINPELLPVTFYSDIPDAYIHDPDARKLKDGDLFDLPEGLNVDEDSVDLDKNGKIVYRGIRLVPSDKEEKEPVNESQEELLNDLRNKYKEDGNWFAEAAISILSKHFTITRKEK